VSSSSTSVTRYNVEVVPDQFAQIGRKYMDGFMDMLFISASQAKQAR
jgi:hypothetical protein